VCVMLLSAFNTSAMSECAAADAYLEYAADADADAGAASDCAAGIGFADAACRALLGSKQGCHLSRRLLGTSKRR